MKTLLRMALATTLLAGLLGASIMIQGTRPAFAVGVVPQSGRVYPTGTVFRGKCGPNGWWTKFEVWANLGWHYMEEVGDNGSQGNPSDPYYCASRREHPGHYRMIYYLDPTNVVLATFTISAGPVNPCTDDDTQIMSVINPNGGPSNLADLQSTHLTPGQIIAADQDVEMTLGDNSVIRMAAGSSLDIPAGCKFDEGTTNWKIQLALTLGKVWAKVTSQFGGHNEMDVRTERVVAGNRGSEYWVSYDPASKLTIVHVISGSVAVSAEGKTVIVTAGATATQQGTQPPVLQAVPATPVPTALPAGTLLDVSGANDQDKMTPAFTVAGPFTVHSQWSVMPGKSGNALFGLNLHDSAGQTTVPFDAQIGSGSKTVVEHANCAHGCRLEIMAQNMKYHVSVVKGN